MSGPFIFIAINRQVFGTPSDAVLEMLRRQAGAGVALRAMPGHLGGFVRR